MQPVRSFAILFMCGAAGWGQANTPRPFTKRIGGVTLSPGGFLELIGEARSATTPDTISTHFGSIPLSDTPGEALWSPRHSRLWMHAVAGFATVYLESDFLNPNAGQSPYRWRQYWAAARWHGWEILGGRAWTLLRPNRRGIASDTATMNTLVVEPAYHVGLVGSRNRQVRIARAMGDYHAVVAWEEGGDFLGKATVDKSFGHLEAAALGGRGGRRAVSVAATLKLSRRTSFVTQEFWSKQAASLALGVVPAHVSGGSAIEGVEFAATRRVMAYGYAGWVYGARSSGNRIVGEYTGGADYEIPAPALHGAVVFSGQLSRINRSLWTGRSGAMTYAMWRMRIRFN